MTDPATMCDKHLVAEHHECHVFEGRIRKGMTLDGYITSNLLEPASVRQRHDDLVAEMLRRGFNHKSPMLNVEGLMDLPARCLTFKIDREAAAAELHSRCPECRKRSQA